MLAPSVEYGFAGRYAIGLDYVWSHIRFDNVVQELGRGFYRIQPRTDLLANFSYGNKDFDRAPDRDATRYIGVLGVRGEITPRLRSTIRVGYEVREPDRGDLGEYSGVVVGGEVVSTPTARTRLTLVLERAVQESVFAGNEIYLANLATLAAEFYLTPKLLLSGRVFGGNAEYFEKVRKVNGAFAWRTDWLYAASVGVHGARRRSPACST